MDKAGNAVGGAITFNPAVMTLAHCESKETTARIEVNEPLTAGMVYFTRIHLKGTARRPVTVELNLISSRQVDFYAESDPCRPRCGHFVEFCHEQRCDDPCCPKCHPASSHFGRGRRSWDPHRHWFDACCERFFLTPLLRTRSCH
jgi:hypothetical protein